jgi:hypothetical protein
MPGKIELSRCQQAPFGANLPPMNTLKLRTMNHPRFLAVFALFAFSSSASRADDFITYAGKDGPGKGKHLVFLTGDEEYRSEEGLPMLAKILSQRHGFDCTVLFSVNDKGEIDPDNQKSLSNPEALDSADAIVMLLRFRNWPEDIFEHFDAAVARGVPIIGLRTSTHAFNGNDHAKFGKEVLGEQWVSHWGRHKSEATRGVIEPASKGDPIFNGVADVFGDTDVYEAYPPEDARILLRGAVLKGMGHDDPPADYKKNRSTDKQEQGVNDPMMPVAWTRVVKNAAGSENKIFCTTLGAATDLQSEDLRRLVVNSVFWGLGMEVPEKANVDYVDPFHPSKYGFKGYRTGITAADHALGKSLPARDDQ